MEAAIKADKTPTCDSCTLGVIKPDVVFFGENLSDRFKELLEVDFNECDLLIVIGTSLKVQPFCSLVQRVKQTTPRLLVRSCTPSSKLTRIRTDQTCLCIKDNCANFGPSFNSTFVILYRLIRREWETLFLSLRVGTETRPC